MTLDELRLRRLFKMASRAKEAEPESIPDHLKMRILSHWRCASAQAEEAVLMIGWVFKRALIAAALITIFCAIWCYDGIINSPDDDIAIANYQLREDVMP